MTKSELIKIIHSENELNYVEVDSIVNQVFDLIVDAIDRDGKVVISGFGTFEKYYQEGYHGVNPSTGDKIFVEDNYKIRFSASKKLKSRVNK